MIQIANAPCSWGVIENVGGLRTTYDSVLDEMAAAGYVGTELGDWGFMPTEPQQLRAELDAHGLQLLASWVSVSPIDPAHHDADVATAVRTAHLLREVGGPEALIVLGDSPYTDPVRNAYAGRITPAQGMSERQWADFSHGVTRVAEAVWQQTGLRTVFHHHTGTWVETPAETERLMSATDPTLLGLVFDTGHWHFAGGNAAAGIRHFGDRIWHVHFKDCDDRLAAQSRREEWDGPTGVGQGVFCELGTGDVDFTAVISALTDIGYDDWIVVEQDVLPGMGTPAANAVRNRAFLRTFGL